MSTTIGDLVIDARTRFAASVFTGLSALILAMAGGAALALNFAPGEGHMAASHRAEVRTVQPSVGARHTPTVVYLVDSPSRGALLAESVHAEAEFLRSEGAGGKRTEVITSVSPNLARTMAGFLVQDAGVTQFHDLRGE
jgi:hypothetical protein